MKKIILLTALFFCCFKIISYAQAGELDSAFGTNGIVRTNLGPNHKDNISLVRQVLVQPDKSMYVTFDANQVTKRRPDGSSDSTFGGNGFSHLTYSEFQDGRVSQIAIQSDGKIISLGDRRENADPYNYYFFLTRYNTDGSLDSTFKENKIQIAEREYPEKVYIQNDGKILAIGNFGFFRFNSDGSRDTTFSGDVNQASSSAVVIQSDGKIVAVSYTYKNDNGNDNYSDFALVRYNTDGSVDNTFGGDGRQPTGFNFSLMAIQSDGKIVIAGDSTLARYNSDGSVDYSFNRKGKQTAEFKISSMTLENDGKIVAAGHTDTYPHYKFTLTRYNNDGSMDNSDSANRNYTTDFEISAISIQSNGEIVAAGTANGNLAIAKYNTAGSMDNTFDNDGRLYDSVVYSRSFFTRMAVQSNGKFAALGSSWINGKSYICQYNADGSLDKTFSGDGVQQINDQIDRYSLSAIYQSDGKLVVGGTSSDRKFSFLFRYNINGSLDTSFSTREKQRIDFYITAIAIQGDKKIVVAGSKGNFPNSKFALARFNIDGTPDNSFLGGKIVTDFSNDNDFARTVAIQSDGKIVVAGSTGNLNVNQDFAIARYNTDGSLDKTFSGDGKQTSRFDSSSYINFIEAIAIQSDGKIVAAGSVIARYNIDGSLDSTFSVSGQENSIYGYFYSAVAIENDNKIIALKYAYSSSPFIRFKANGSLDTAFGVNGKIITPFRELNDMVVVNNSLYAVGSTGESFYSGSGVVARFLLYDSSENNTPSVTLSIPYNIIKYSAPARIKLNAVVSNVSGKIKKVQFYNGSTLLHTEDVAPYGFFWTDVPAGNYTLTAKAFDNSGNVITSNAINVSVVNVNVPPVVNIVSPVNDTTYNGPATIRLTANAKDPNDRIGKVEFYNGTTLLRTEYYYPYTYTWTNVQPGTYTITAKAYDDKGLSTTSAPVTVTVDASSLPIVRSKPVFENNKTDLNAALSLTLSPNPARSTLQISAKGLQLNKPSTISVISASGVLMKTVRANSASQLLDVSSLASGVYTVKVVSGDKVMCQQFLKL